MKRITTIFLTFLIAFVAVMPANAQNQVRFKRLFGNRYKRENVELRQQIDSMRKAIDELRQENLLKDSLAQEMLLMYEENEDKSAAGLNPEDYSAEITDSLLSIWYLHRQVMDDRNGEDYDMDSVYFTSNVSDAVLKDRLENLNSFITLPYNETVRNYMVLYSEKMPTKMGNILGLCQYYMPIFEETFSKYDLPDELKYVAIIESALNPIAVSRAGAKGMWQFMTKTAKSYGLEINSYVDERFDPFKSSDAAARYLKDSYKLFGDWNLAISSYNCGPGNVNKAIRRSGSRDFWAVYDYLPRETRGYVPAFVGAMYALKYNKEYGLTPNSVPMPVQVDTFEIHKNLHFQQISDLIGITVEELENLNPQYIKDVVPGNSGTYILRAKAQFSNEAEEWQDVQNLPDLRIVVVSNETRIQATVTIPVRIAGNDFQCRTDDWRCVAVVYIKKDPLCIRIIQQELFHDPCGSTAKRVNRLVIITNSKQVAVSFCKQIHNGILNLADILKLIDQKKGEMILQ